VEDGREAGAGEEVFVADAGHFDASDRCLVTHGDLVIGVFRVGAAYHAYLNRCVHQGGPVCEGLILGKVEAVLGADREVVQERFSDTELHLICPWHGYEYDLETGRCVPDQRLRLRRFEVVERDGGVYVRT
jgi:nitrite reductase/ring-hydroxylating ferredoxin subunit